MGRFSMKTAPARAGQAFVFGDIRISVITDRIIRVEKEAKNGFCDKATQMVICRNFAAVDASAEKKGNTVFVTAGDKKYEINICTLTTTAVINGRRVSPSASTNLGGTARTLDGTFGILGSWKTDREKKDRFCFEHMRKGIFSSNGIAEIDDSDSFLFNEDGSIELRDEVGEDKYVFAFGDDYLGGLKEFYSLCGATPVLPKYALGNWWSRYHAYTQSEYLALMKKFRERNIPLTVATIDMDWHIVRNVPRDVRPTVIQGAGWTGYTFEEKLFPDHKAFFDELKSNGLAVTMNLHPHDGVRYFEKQYKEMCEATGQNPDEKKPVRFNLTDPVFRDAYFDILHHPYENEGVDFWWIDWQQGTTSKIMHGLDPLWLLNHYHFLDNCRNGKTGMILSRYAGLGSHRYPLGFSGDTFVCWKSLALQPWFTANASNAGYTWWSHDIGGHVLNSGNNELYLRWLQFGVFSPVNRLHSNNTSISKEPWNFPKVQEKAEDFLRLRHRLLPYLYTANILTSREGIPLVCPMYYRDKSENARNKKYANEYYFGTELIVAPVTQRTAKGRPNVRFYLPEGEWTDIFTGKKYSQGEYEIQCPLDRYPVFAKAGAVIPMLPEREGNSQDFGELFVRIFPGKNTYTLFDDDGESVLFEVDGENVTVTPSARSKVRKITLHFENCEKKDEILSF
ncbi:MAG: alpha-xylosidase [Clostridia bacterium]|nr:alpha-xylosidase [Clostridia bacterium]